MLDVIELDTIRWNYYDEIGYDATYAQKLRDQQGMKALAEYWKPFDIHAVERVLSDYPSNVIISFGAGHSVYEDPSMLERAKKAVTDHAVVLLVPSSDVDESVEILGTRILAKEPFLTVEFIDRIKDINRFFLKHPSNSTLATITVFTKDKQPDDSCQDIIGLLKKRLL